MPIQVFSIFIALFFLFPATVFSADDIQAPDIGAGSYLLIDFQSGDVLASKNNQQKIEPASITKVMTAYVIYQELEKGFITLDETVLISTKAWEMKGSRMFIKAGSKVKLDKLMHGLIIQSGNDSAVALAEHIAGSEDAFVSRMNLVAKEIGLSNTHFSNVTGWPASDHYTTADDIATLAKRLIIDYPEHYKLYAQKEYTFNKINQKNRNQLLWKDDTVDGIKTGHTESAGFCLLASAKRNNMRLISVVLGANSTKERTAYTRQLLEYGFKNYETHLLYKEGSILTEAHIWKGNTDKIPLGTITDLYVTIHKDHYKKIKGVMDIDKGIDAPITRGDVLGKIKLLVDNEVVREAPLVAMRNVGEGGSWDRLVDSIKKLFN